MPATVIRMRVASPGVATFVGMQVLRRVRNFALARPAREVRFTSVPREDRYKAKNFIDTVVYRGGDQVGSWAYAALIGLGLTLTGVALVAVPVSAAWLGLSCWLGSRQARWERRGADTARAGMDQNLGRLMNAAHDRMRRACGYAGRCMGPSAVDS